MVMVNPCLLYSERVHCTNCTASVLYSCFHYIMAQQHLHCHCMLQAGLITAGRAFKKSVLSLVFFVLMGMQCNDVCPSDNKVSRKSKTCSLLTRCLCLQQPSLAPPESWLSTQSLRGQRLAHMLQFYSLLCLTFTLLHD